MKPRHWYVAFGVTGLCFLAVLIAILEKNAFEYSERHVIKSYETQLFKVVEKDSETDCYLLSTDITLQDSNQILLFGIRLNLGYVNTDYQHFWEKEQLPLGWYGNHDTIKSLEISTANHSVVEDLTEASEFKYFSLMKGSLNNHSAKPVASDERSCYTAQTLPTVKDVIKNYNGSSNGSSIPGLDDYHLFLVPDSLRGTIITNGIDTRLINTSDEVIPKR